MLERVARVENMNLGCRASVMSKKKMPFWSLSRLSRPPQASTRSSLDVWQWWASLPMLPGGGTGTVLSTLP